MYQKVALVFFTVIFYTGCDNSKSKSKVSIEKTESIILPKGEYQIDKTKSVVRWIGRTPVKFHDGTIDIQEGNFSVDDNGILNGNIIIDMESINCTDLSGGGKKSLEEHLMNDDFFSVNKFKTSKINISSEMKPNNGLIDFKGSLEIKNISNPISFKSSINKTPEGKYTASSKLTFDRSMYNVKYKSKSFFDDLGDKFINDDIEIELEIITL
jgi:polyisoprenoid-binding protein YceI|tara:strand:- start:1872 stop:2507 length:636 start_codon:yes stop_codon:yes gene_type:complete